MVREFGLMAKPVLSPFSINRNLHRQKRKIELAILNNGGPIVTPTPLGDLRLDIP